MLYSCTRPWTHVDQGRDVVLLHTPMDARRPGEGRTGLQLRLALLWTERVHELGESRASPGRSTDCEARRGNLADTSQIRTSPPIPASCSSIGYSRHIIGHARNTHSRRTVPRVAPHSPPHHPSSLPVPRHPAQVPHLLHLLPALLEPSLKVLVRGGGIFDLLAVGLRGRHTRICPCPDSEGDI